jgi:hypothetical protein
LARLQAPPAFSPPDIASLSVWLDASDASSLVLNSGNVSEWQSKVGSVVFSQGTAVSQPALLAAELNAKNVVSFDGIEGFLQADSPAVSGTPCTIVVVAKWKNGNDGIAAVFGQTGSQLVLYNGNPATLATAATTSHSASGAGSNVFMATFRLYNGVDMDTFEPAPLAEWLVVAAVANEGQSRIFFNNALKVTGNAGAGLVGGDAYLGAYVDGSDYTAVDVAEVLTFNAELTLQERSDLHTYLFDKWGITVA